MSIETMKRTANPLNLVQPPFMTSQNEQETNITFDYGISEVRIYSTRQGVIDGILKRIGNKPNIVREGNFLTLPMKYCRHPKLIARVLNKAVELEPDEELAS